MVPASSLSMSTGRSGVSKDGDEAWMSAPTLTVTTTRADRNVMATVAGPYNSTLVTATSVNNLPTLLPPVPLLQPSGSYLSLLATQTRPSSVRSGSVETGSMAPKTAGAIFGTQSSDNSRVERSAVFGQSEFFETETFFQVEKEWESVTTLKLVFERAGLDQDQQRKFLAALEPATFRCGHYVVRQGDPGDDGFYIITQGEVKVTRAATDEERSQPPPGLLLTKDRREVVLTHMYEGHFFGELALVNDQPRNANIIVSSDEAHVMRMSKERFKPFLEQDPKFRKMIGELVMKKEETARRRAEMLKGNTNAVITPEEQLNEVRITTLNKKGRTANGKMVINGYVLMHKLGQGSYGVVWLAASRQHSKKYAIKVVSRTLLKKKRFGSEAKSESEALKEVAVMKRLAHPNIVALYEVIDDASSDKIYMVCEFAELGPVMTETEYNSPLPPEVARKYFRDIICGLEYLHFQGVIHRDIKPSNVLISSDGTAKIADFGAAALTEDGEGNLSEVKGTPAFQPPEVFLLEKGQRYSGFAVDIWALGATLHTMVVGVPPYMADNEWQLVEKLKTEDFRLSTTVQLDPHLRNVLTRCLTKEVGKRITLPEIMCHEWVTEEGANPLITRPYVKLNLAETAVTGSARPESAHLDARKLEGNVGETEAPRPIPKSTTVGSLQRGISNEARKNVFSLPLGRLPINEHDHDSAKSPAERQKSFTRPPPELVDSARGPSSLISVDRPSKEADALYSLKETERSVTTAFADARNLTMRESASKASFVTTDENSLNASSGGKPPSRVSARFRVSRQASLHTRSPTTDDAALFTSPTRTTTIGNSPGPDNLLDPDLSTSAQQDHLRALRLRQHKLLTDHTSLGQREKDLLADQKRIAFHADRADATVEAFYVDSKGRIAEAQQKPRSLVKTRSSAEDESMSSRIDDSQIYPTVTEAYPTDAIASGSFMRTKSGYRRDSSGSSESTNVEGRNGHQSLGMHTEGSMLEFIGVEQTTTPRGRTVTRADEDVQVTELSHSEIDAGAASPLGLRSSSSSGMQTLSRTGSIRGTLSRQESLRKMGGGLQRAQDFLMIPMTQETTMDGGAVIKKVVFRAKGADGSLSITGGFHAAGDDTSRTPRSSTSSRSHGVDAGDAQDSDHSESANRWKSSLKKTTSRKFGNQSALSEDDEDLSESASDSDSDSSEDYGEIATVDDMKGNAITSNLGNLLGELISDSNSDAADPHFVELTPEEEESFIAIVHRGIVATYPRGSWNPASVYESQIRVLDGGDSLLAIEDAPSDADSGYSPKGVAKRSASMQWASSPSPNQPRIEALEDTQSNASNNSAVNASQASARYWNATVFKDRLVCCPIGELPDLGLIFAIADSKGRRATMEDRAVAIPNLDAYAKAKFALSTTVESRTRYSFFAVFDGHNGTQAAELLAQKFHDRLCQKLLLDGSQPSSSTPATAAADAPVPLPGSTIENGASGSGERDETDELADFLDESQALVDACLEMDTEIQAAGVPGEEISGSTGLILLLRQPVGEEPAFAFCANVGDCRAVLSRNGLAVELSFDHKPSRPDEAARIEAAGGSIIKGRLHGVLAVSRGFGDAEHKRSYGQDAWGQKFTADPLSAEPEVTHEPLDEQDEFIIMACDGIWDVFSSQLAVTFVRRRLLVHADVGRAARELVNKAIDMGSIDNCTAIVVCFRQRPNVQVA
jgi:[calcium/calmodulin-dependent protein kinase] kinase